MSTRRKLVGAASAALISAAMMMAPIGTAAASPTAPPDRGSSETPDPNGPFASGRPAPHARATHPPASPPLDRRAQLYEPAADPGFHPLDSTGSSDDAAEKLGAGRHPAAAAGPGRGDQHGHRHDPRSQGRRRRCRRGGAQGGRHRRIGHREARATSGPPCRPTASPTWPALRREGDRPEPHVSRAHAGPGRERRSRVDPARTPDPAPPTRAPPRPTPTCRSPRPAPRRSSTRTPNGTAAAPSSACWTPASTSGIRRCRRRATASPRSSTGSPRPIRSRTTTAPGSR